MATSVAKFDRSVLLSGDYMGVRDDDALPGDPACPLHPKAAGRTDDAYDTPTCRPDIPIAKDARVGRRDLPTRRRSVLDLRYRVDECGRGCGTDPERV